MTATYRDPDADDFWQPRRDRREVVREKLASIGISLDDARPMPGPVDIAAAELIGPPLPYWWGWRDELVMLRGWNVPVSRHLCAMMHWRIPGGIEVPAMPEGLSDDEAELRSIDEARRW